MEVNKKISLGGVVQGVGFRPFVYQLAHRYALKGFVLNDSEGVEVEIEGSSDSIDYFMKSLHQELPALARIDSIESRDGKLVGHTEFKIIESQNNTEKMALISPDIALCEKCLSEMNDPSNRRYQYPFINCTDCGPRYSVIETVPYDRPNTSMRFFKMCKACKEEYLNPLDRRFHAQPISCFSCGPTLTLLDTKQNVLSKNTEAVKMAVNAIQEGKIIALKGLGGFHLVCDANNAQAVSLLRKRKNRRAKPFAVMFSDMQSLKESAELSSEEELLVRSKEKPIVIASKRERTMVCEEVSPGIERIGVFLPYTPLHHLLLQGVGKPIVATSANLSDEPIIRDSKNIVEKLGHVVDLVLDHDRDIINANDDSVVQIVEDKRVFLRMARGFMPMSIKLPFKSDKNILAVGANQKNTIALIFDDKLIISPHIGDLNSIEAFEYFERTVETFKRVYDFKPEVIVCDKHPQYETSKWAQRLKEQMPSLPLFEVQHHYAHLLAVKAEHNLSEKVLGFAFDGTGYGDDGTIWGSEIMIADDHRYDRKYSLKQFRLLGSEKAVKEPYRSALALLFESFSLEEVMELDLDLTHMLSKEELMLLHKAWEKGLNSPYCSSMGRLFDAVASLANIIHISSFEGESGLKMEGHVDEAITQSFTFTIKEGVIDLEAMMQEIIKINDEVKIVSMFFNTLVEIIVEVASLHPELPLVFSGGVFQNKVLLQKIEQRFKEMKRRIYYQTETSVNDGGVSLGQAWFALHNL